MKELLQKVKNFGFHLLWRRTYTMQWSIGETSRFVSSAWALSKLPWLICFNTYEVKTPEVVIASFDVGNFDKTYAAHKEKVKQVLNANG